MFFQKPIDLHDTISNDLRQLEMGPLCGVLLLMLQKPKFLSLQPSTN